MGRINGEAIALIREADDDHTIALLSAIPDFEDACKDIDDGVAQPLFDLKREALNDAVDRYIKEVRDLEDLIKENARVRTRAEKEVREKTIKLEKLRKAAALAMKSAGAVKYAGTRGCILLVKSPRTVLIIDKEAVPEEFKTRVETVEMVIDRQSLQQYLENGNKLRGAVLRESEHVRISK